MLSKVPGGYLDVRTKGRAPGFGGHGEIVAGTQANCQKALANSRLAAPALHVLTCSAQACQTPTSLPPDTRGKFYLYKDRFCVVTVVLGYHLAGWRHSCGGTAGGGGATSLTVGAGKVYWDLWPACSDRGCSVPCRGLHLLEDPVSRQGMPGLSSRWQQDSAPGLLCPPLPQSPPHPLTPPTGK